MRFSKPILLLLAGLLVQQAQCLAACAVDTCSQSLPPCHRQHRDQSPDHNQLCLHHAVTAGAVQIDIVALPAEVAPSYFPSLSPFTTNSLPVTTSSPPGPSLAVLRI